MWVGGCRGGTRTHDFKVMSLANSPLFYSAREAPEVRSRRKKIGMCDCVEQKKGDRTAADGVNSALKPRSA